MSIGRTLKREVRVATSRRAQPVWFRVLKWIVFAVLVTWFWSSPYFWWWIGSGVAAGLSVHLVWRWKTKGWTEPWLGWSDLETANKGEPGESGPKP